MTLTGRYLEDFAVGQTPLRGMAQLTITTGAREQRYSLPSATAFAWRAASVMW